MMNIFDELTVGLELSEPEALRYMRDASTAEVCAVRMHEKCHCITIFYERKVDIVKGFHCATYTRESYYEFCSRLMSETGYAFMEVEHTFIKAQCIAAMNRNGRKLEIKLQEGIYSNHECHYVLSFLAMTEHEMCVQHVQMQRMLNMCKANMDDF